MSVPFLNESDEAGRSSQPRLNLTAFRHLHVIQDQKDAGDGSGKLLVHQGKKGNALGLSLSRVSTSIDLATAGIKGRKQVQSPNTLVLVLQAQWVAWPRWKGGSSARTWLQIGFLIHAQDPLSLA